MTSRECEVLRSKLRGLGYTFSPFFFLHDRLVYLFSPIHIFWSTVLDGLTVNSFPLFELGWWLLLSAGLYEFCLPMV
jgi:hypothetical protein